MPRKTTTPAADSKPPVEADENGLSPEVLATTVDSLELDKDVEAALLENDPPLATVADVVGFANANNGLTPVTGIGPVSEKEILDAIDKLSAGETKSPAAEVDYVAEHAALLDKLAELEAKYAEVVSQNDRLAQELTKAAEQVAAARKARVPADVVQIVLRREHMVGGERCQIGHRLAQVFLDDGVSLNFLVDAVRNGLTKEA